LKALSFNLVGINHVLCSYMVVEMLLIRTRVF
jgi:hypothetical protein